MTCILSPHPGVLQGHSDSPPWERLFWPGEDIGCSLGLEHGVGETENPAGLLVT